ncbi:MAG: beta-propeller fold lactonase family protein [Candidatus Accumulibacter sp.]|jgi:6-phosphogluconolactonase|nr:beta-propeller fold lactonase family protein [Accumulibacter sp.]
MTQTFIYVSCAASREIAVFSLDGATGGVALRQRLPVPGSPTPMRVSPDGRLLLVGLRGENALLTCSIDRTSGLLATLGCVPAPGAPAYVSCDGAARNAFMASYGDNLLAVFPLGPEGHPAPAAQIETGLPRAHAALADASGRWLLAPMPGADAIRVYRIADGGRIERNAPPPVMVRPGSGPRHPVFSAGGRFVYCLNELDGSIDLFAFDADTGTLEPRQSMSMMPHGFDGAPWAAELRVAPGGAFLYASDRRSSTLAVLSVDARNGQLSLFGHYPTEIQPRGMAIDPSGRYLAVAGQLSHHLAIYALDPETGRPDQCFRHETGEDPICVETVALPTSADG